MPTTDSSPSSRRWIKPRELADREGVHRATIWRWVEKGLLEARRLEAHVGVRVRYAATDKGGK